MVDPNVKAVLDFLGTGLLVFFLSVICCGAWWRK